MIHHRKRGLVAIHGLLLLVLQQVLFVPFVLGTPGDLLAVPQERLLLGAYYAALLAAGLISLQFLRDFADRLPHFGLFDSISLANRQAVVLGLMFIIVAFVARDDETSRLLLVLMVGATWVVAFLANYYLPPILSRTLFAGQHRLPTLLVGSQRTALRLKDWIDQSRSLGFQFEGLVVFEAQAETPSIWGMPVIGDYTQLDRLIREKSISQVIVLETLGSKRWLDFLVDKSAENGCRVLIYNNWEEIFERPLAIVREGEHTFFSFQEEPLENPISRLVKRGFDVAFSLPVCLLILPPLAIVFWIAQRLQSPGPLLYRQSRCGRRGEHFTIFKFRSMHTGARRGGDEAQQAVRGDRRVFPLGALMRRFSLDEMPQFLNALRGDMSVVGPRPHLVQHDEIFAQETKYYRTRFFVKPGITGLAQVKGFRGEITDPQVLHERVRWDLAYIRGWSIWLDLLIVIRTLRHVFWPPASAY